MIVFKFWVFFLIFSVSLVECFFNDVIFSYIIDEINSMFSRVIVMCYIGLFYYGGIIIILSCVVLVFYLFF